MCELQVEDLMCDLQYKEGDQMQNEMAHASLLELLIDR